MNAPQCFGTRRLGLCMNPTRFVTSAETGACGQHVAGLFAWHLEGADAAPSVEVHSVEAWLWASSEEELRTG